MKIGALLEVTMGIKKLLFFIGDMFVACSIVIPINFFYQNLSSRSITTDTFKVRNQTLIITRFETQGIGLPKKRVEKVIFENDIFETPNGYNAVYLNDLLKCLILGSRFLFLFSGKPVENDKGGDNSVILYGADETIENDRGKPPSEKLELFFRLDYAKGYVSVISASSTLTEILNGKKVSYSVSGLTKRIIEDGERSYWNGDANPWVEGVEGPGIGECLEISFSEPSNDVVMLNGFVDPTRRHLFKANNRVKTAIIRSADSREPFEFEYQFEDMVRFDEIRFPRPAEKIVFEIKDVYPGEKWDDTCISAVLTREPDPYLQPGP